MSRNITIVAPDLRQGLPGDGYGNIDISTTSNTIAFERGINQRDGERCIVCGIDGTVQHCYIMPQVEHAKWEELKRGGLIPRQTKSVKHECRNGILMCLNHHHDFDQHNFFIRWDSEQKLFIFINHSRKTRLQKHHGCAVNLDANHCYVPFYGLFYMHEILTRAHYPHMPDPIIIIPTSPQQWMLGQASEDEDQDGASGDEDKENPVIRRRTVVLDNPFSTPEKYEQLMKTIQADPVWKEMLVEGESWEGTAEENIQKYKELMESMELALDD